MDNTIIKLKLSSIYGDYKKEMGRGMQLSAAMIADYLDILSEYRETQDKKATFDKLKALKQGFAERRDETKYETVETFYDMLIREIETQIDIIARK